MKRTFTLLFCLVALCFDSHTTFAQQKQAARISMIKQKDEVVTITVVSNGEFYVGNNVHVLYIGNKHFDLYDQQNENGKGTLKFFVPATDYRLLQNGTPVYLSYGELQMDENQNIEDMCKQNFCPCWSVGKLNKKLLK